MRGKKAKYLRKKREQSAIKSVAGQIFLKAVNEVYAREKKWYMRLRRWLNKTIKKT